MWVWLSRFDGNRGFRFGLDRGKGFRGRSSLRRLRRKRELFPVIIPRNDGIPGIIAISLRGRERGGGRGGAWVDYLRRPVREDSLSTCRVCMNREMYTGVFLCGTGENRVTPTRGDDMDATPVTLSRDSSRYGGRGRRRVLLSDGRRPI